MGRSSESLRSALYSLFVHLHCTARNFSLPICVRGICFRRCCVAWNACRYANPLIASQRSITRGHRFGSQVVRQIFGFRLVPWKLYESRAVTGWQASAPRLDKYLKKVLPKLVKKSDRLLEAESSRAAYA